MSKLKILFITGIRRSGTTLLCSLIGGHSQINMSCESFDKSLFKPAGKKYNGNKIPINNMSLRNRTSIFKLLVNRFSIRLFGKRLFTRIPYSIQDLYNKNAKIIKIIRGKKENINSIKRWENWSYKKSKKIYENAKHKLDKVDGYEITLYDLTHNTKAELIKLCNHLDIDFEQQMLDGYKYITHADRYKKSKIVKKK